MSDHPFEITVHDRAFRREGWVGDPVACTFTPRLHSLGTGEITVRASDEIAGALLAKGSRVRVLYEDGRLLSGRVKRKVGDVSPSGLLTVQVEDYHAWLRRTLAWVQPVGSPYSNGELEPTDLFDTAQSWEFEADYFPEPMVDPFVSPYMRWPNGEAATGGILTNSTEQAVKYLVRRNLVQRLGRPVTVAPNADPERGGDPRAAGMLPDVRFGTVEDYVVPLLEWGDLALEFWHEDGETTVGVDVRELGEWSATITPESGILPAGAFTLDDPEATRIVLGGPGDLGDRAFYGRNDETGLEDEYGDVWEVFRDATGGRIVWPETVPDHLRRALYYLLRPEPTATDKAALTSYVDGAGAKALAEGRPVSGLSLELSESESFRFGGEDGVQLGDLLHFNIRGQLFDERVTEATIAWSKDDGLTVSPRVGKYVDDPDQELADAVGALADAVRRLSADK